MTPRLFGDVTVGDALPTREHVPTRVGLFLFGVAYWTSHRIHYDIEFARSEGYDDVLVTANLLSAWNAQLVTDWAGDAGCLRSLTERNVSPAVAGDRLVVAGRVVELEPGADGGLVHCALQVTTSGGTVVVEARATLHLSD